MADTPRVTVPVEDLLFYKLKDLILEQSEGEWTDEMIVRDAHHFANHIRPLLSAAPAPEGGAVNHEALAKVGYEASCNKKWEWASRGCKIGWIDAVKAIIAALAARDEAPACKKCGGKGYTEHEGGEGEGYPSRPEIEACSCREEAPTEAREREAIARIIAPQTFDLIASYTSIDRGDGQTPDQREPSVFKAYPTLETDRDQALAKADAILALRAQPQARSTELDAAIKRLTKSNLRYRCENGQSQAGDDMSLVLSTIKRLTKGAGQ